MKRLYKPVEIECPKCKVRVMTYDGRATTNQIARCPVCLRKVIYNVGTKEIVTGDIVKRDCSSGMRFY